MHSRLFQIERNEEELMSKWELENYMEDCEFIGEVADYVISTKEEQREEDID